jgi:hypothetical protein
MRDSEELLKLIKEEINNAKLKAFDELLYFLLSDYPTHGILEELEDKVLVVYGDYKDDIKNIVKLYTPGNKVKTDKTMEDFLKSLKDLEDQ